MVFRFKKFKVNQQNSAMKVGTDGVLLGAWADFRNPKTILDIGSGTGLIALMLAQRFPDAGISAVEIEHQAAAESKLNFKKSAWSERMTLIENDFLDFNPEKTFDLLVSNPPYFINDLASNDKKRAGARNGELPLESLFEKARKLMHQQSRFCLIYPYDKRKQLNNAAIKNGFYPNELSLIYPIKNVPPKRILIAFGLIKNKELAESSLIIEENGRHQYSSDYRILTKDFYLKF